MKEQEENKKSRLHFAKTILINFIGVVVIILLAILLYTDINQTLEELYENKNTSKA